MIDERQRPWIVAHRGATHDAMENTTDAFREAARLGVDAVELDVRRTADMRIVVHHDSVVETDGPPLVEMTRAAISARYPWIPDLDTALAACKGMWVNVEIKNSPLDSDWDPDQRLAEAVAFRLQGRDDIVVSSFNPAVVARCAEVAPALARALLVGAHGDHALVAPVPLRAVHVHHSLLEGRGLQHWLARSRAENWWLLAWTVNEPTDIERLRAIDGLITDVPAVALSLLQEHRDR